MWNPDIYLRFADERGRPFHDLVARIAADDPREVVDLGCGPGNLTETLAARWPGARVRGLDSSAEMIEKAKTQGGSVATQGGSVATQGGSVAYEVADVRDYVPGPDVDVITTNAVLQWVPGHEQLLTAWAAALRSGAWLALQVPGNQDAPAHLALRELCGSPRWADRLGELDDQVRRVPDATGYARLLRDAGCDVDAWETEYLHQLPVGGPEHPVLTWLSGTALRPVRALLDDAGWDEFRAGLQPALERAYPPYAGIVDFPFRRVFATARKR
ncbi:trans-aconitate 2-methyltransferase [Catellatospora sp. TT07R-123]|uniref:trans-aconitate 2-methyltransferase n=1 Tax=Catellatospora sp. TT07R-123 TaxID=2733863 RepID=UPI001B27A5AE|nr:trans-aconitate 2-methyltransferase [Catellatospora sp. TT07R-123]GHJ48608.1 trans-aconitate 2-methyltransferase [Catellatospora sp. TT07R-123]